METSHVTAISWKNATSGNWTTANDWSTGAVPGAADDATLDLTSGYTVTITTPIIVNSISIADSSATLSVNDPGHTISITGNPLAGGSLDVDANGGQGGTSLSIGGTLGSSNFIAIGNSSLSAATLVSAAALSDSGTIQITGSAGDQATLD